MIALGKEFAKKAREEFDKNPHKTYYIKLDGDPWSGKSLILDTMKAELFGEEIPAFEDRAIRHYDGKIGDKSARISFINADAGPAGDLYLAAGLATRGKNHPGFVFVSNQKRLPSIGQLGKSFMEINVKFPDEVQISTRARWLGTDKNKPETPAREITAKTFDN